MDGKGPSVADVATYKPNTDVKDYKSHVAMDDATLLPPWPTRMIPIIPSAAASTSIIIIKKILPCLPRWALPCCAFPSHGPVSSPTGEEAQPNEKGLQFYSDLFAEMHKNGIEPLVTLSHYEMPLALATKYNGWVDRRVIDCFAKFCHVCFERYKDQVKYWLTFNEGGQCDPPPLHHRRHHPQPCARG